MLGLSGSDILFLTGTVFMAAASMTAIICVVVFTLTGRKLRERLEQEYGKPWN